MEAVSSTKRARCFAYFSIFLGMGSFLGAMVGAALLSLPATLTVAGHTIAMASSYNVRVSVLVRLPRDRQRLLRQDFPRTARGSAILAADVGRRDDRRALPRSACGSAGRMKIRKATKSAKRRKRKSRRVQGA